MTPETTNRNCFQLRTATPADLPDVLSLVRRSGLPIEGIGADALRDFVIAECGGKLIGVAGLEVYQDSALLRSAAVEDSWRGTGVGRALVDRALAIAEEHGVHDIFLLTTTAEHYFPRFGFVGVDRASVPQSVQASAEFRGACPSTALVMRKEINPA